MSVSVVVILEKTSEFQTSRVCCFTVAKGASAGICSLTFWQACSVEMNETPTRDLTFFALKVKMAPRRAVEVTLGVSEYCASPLPALLPSPRNVFHVGSESK